MRTTVSLPKPLLDNAKRRATERGVSLSALLEDALRSHLTDIGASAPPFRLHTVRGKLVSPRLDLDRTSALVVVDDQSDYSDRKE